VPLEAGHGLVVLARMSDGTLDQVRTLSDDCPIDAGGRAVYWLDGVTAAQSLAWLDRQTGVEATTAAARVETDRLRSIASAALTAVALHAAPDADRILERIATSDAADNLRRQAGSRMAAYRGAAGFEALRRLIAAEADEATRRSFVSALGQTRELGAADVLLELARTDPAPRVRGEAAYHYIRFAGEAGADAIVTLIERDAELSVKRRAISGLAALPGDAGIPHLIELARRSQDLTVKKEAVSAITRSDDPRARAFLAEIIRS
jgi:HEAT repeat protein